jgi:seryl-tRNA(Sec) selenium transferase
MAEEKKAVKGGFRATLALLISIIALVIAVMAFNRSGRQAELEAEIQSLRSKMKKLTEETSEHAAKLRRETGKALEKLGVKIKGTEDKPKTQDQPETTD